MTNVVLDGFDTYPTGDVSTGTNVLTGSPWQLSTFSGTTSGITVSTTAPANGTRSLFWNGFAIGISQPIPDNAVYCWGFRIRCAAFTAGGTVYGCGIIGTVALFLSIDSTGHPILRRGATTIWTAADPVAAGTYQYLDAVYDRTGGTCLIYLNGTLIGTVNSITSIGTITTARVGNILLTANSSHTSTYVDDVYFNSGNDRYGEIGVIILAPNADLGGNQWTVNGVASGFQALDNVPENAAQYIEAVNVGDISGFDLPETPLGTFQIFTVVNRYRAQKTDAGAGEMRGFLQIGAGSYAGANRVLVQGTYTSYDDRYDLNPATGLPWVPADFVANNTALGYERTA